jgi:L-seryl-tRNA(Ser) seleniumtransferase
MATHLTPVTPGDVVIGVSASHSHPSVVRAAEQVEARFIHVADPGAFCDAIATHRSVALVVLTRLAVTYDQLPLEAIETIVRLAHDRAPSSMSTMPAVRGWVLPLFGQPRKLELGVDIGATGLDNYGTKGPRFDLLHSRAAILHCFSPARAMSDRFNA